MAPGAYDIQDLKTGMEIVLFNVAYGYIMGSNKSSTISGWVYEEGDENKSFSKFKVTSFGNNIFAFENGPSKYLACETAQNKSNISLSSEEHQWKLHPGSHLDSYWFESMKFEGTCWYAQSKDGNYARTWKANDFKDNELGWRSFRMRIVPPFSEREEALQKKQEDVAKMEDAAKSAQESADRSRQDLEKREEDLHKREEAVRLAAEKAKQEQAKRETEFSNHEAELDKREESIAKAQQNGETDESLRKQLEEYKQELDNYKASMRKQMDSMTQQEQGLNLREKGLESDERQIASPNLTAEINKLRDENSSLRTRIRKANEDYQREPFVHSRTPFDLTETGPGASHEKFLHLKRLP